MPTVLSLLFDFLTMKVDKKITILSRTKYKQVAIKREYYKHQDCTKQMLCTLLASLVALIKPGGVESPQLRLQSGVLRYDSPAVFKVNCGPLRFPEGLLPDGRPGDPSVCVLDGDSVPERERLGHCPWTPSLTSTGCRGFGATDAQI